EEDEVKITLISFVKENKKKQKEKIKKDVECTSNARPSGRNWPLGLSIPDTEPGQSLLKACSSGPEHDDHREEDLRRSEHVATKEEVMAVMEVSYRERSGGGSLVGVISCLTWTWRRSRWCCCGEGEANQTAVSWGGGRDEEDDTIVKQHFFEILIFETTFEKPKNCWTVGLSLK
ncbi:unnamed protein product, partial [Brassica oleracea]